MCTKSDVLHSVYGDGIKRVYNEVSDIVNMVMALQRVYNEVSYRVFMMMASNVYTMMCLMTVLNVYTMRYLTL